MCLGASKSRASFGVHQPDQRLAGKDLVVLGFWTDWGYLNEIIGTVLAGPGLASVTVVDLLDEAQLIAKAPELWATLNLCGTFNRFQASGNDALMELRLYARHA